MVAPSGSDEQSASAKPAAEVPVSAPINVSVKVSVVVTLYNEEENVEKMARNLFTSMRSHLSDVPFELILVLNGSLDKTPQRAEQIAADIPEVKLVRLQVNQGYGGGIKAGLACAQGEFVGYTDADEQISADDSAKIFAQAAAGQYDLVKAVRKERHDGAQRFIVTTVYNLLFRVMFGTKRGDINAKPKVFKREALQKLVLSANDWFIDAEAMIQAERLQFSIKEIPIVFEARRHGTSNVRLSTMVEFLKNMWKYRNGQS